MVVQQQSTFYEIPQQDAGNPSKPVATIRIAEMQADIYPGADSEMIQAIYVAFKRC